MTLAVTDHRQPQILRLSLWSVQLLSNMEKRRNLMNITCTVILFTSLYHLVWAETLIESY